MVTIIKEKKLYFFLRHTIIIVFACLILHTDEGCISLYNYNYIFVHQNNISEFGKSDDGSNKYIVQEILTSMHSKF